jgi:hypothetical protein
MYGEKPAESGVQRMVHSEWKWTYPEYSFDILKNIGLIKTIEIDPSQRLADVNRSNNKLVIPD